jgi:hypothetical protein
MEVIEGAPFTVMENSLTLLCVTLGFGSSAWTQNL